MRKWALTLVLAALSADASMAAGANPVFASASIKPSDPSEQGKGFWVRGSEFSTINTSLSDMLTFAYGLHPRQIAGGPAWLESDRFDLAAKADAEATPTEEQWKIMLQNLLADRFKLAFHRNRKDLSVYALQVGQDGPKLIKSAGDPGALPDLFFRELGVLSATNTSMADLAREMQRAMLDRPVVDQTGVSGRWDFTLAWTPDKLQSSQEQETTTLGLRTFLSTCGGALKCFEPQDHCCANSEASRLVLGNGIKVTPPPGNTTPPPDLPTAIEEQLGLKLVAAKAPVDVLVVDHAEKPSAH
jgi:uncharacterized protein (TIGR03435 family)